jgi:hypothetical protein
VESSRCWRSPLACPAPLFARRFPTRRPRPRGAAVSTHGRRQGRSSRSRVSRCWRRRLRLRVRRSPGRRGPAARRTQEAHNAATPGRHVRGCGTSLPFTTSSSTAFSSSRVEPTTGSRSSLKPEHFACPNRRARPDVDIAGVGEEFDGVWAVEKTVHTPSEKPERHVMVVYCRRCGAVLGIPPAN